MRPMPAGVGSKQTCSHLKSHHGITLSATPGLTAEKDDRLLDFDLQKDEGCSSRTKETKDDDRSHSEGSREMEEEELMEERQREDKEAETRHARAEAAGPGKDE